MTKNNQAYSPKKIKILVVGDEDSAKLSWKNRIIDRDKDFAWCYTQDRLAFIQILTSFLPQIIILDRGKPGFSVFDAHYLIKEIYQDAPVIVLVQQETESKEWGKLGVSLCARRDDNVMIGHVLDCLLLDANEGCDISFNMRLLDKIQENIEGLGKIRAFLQGGISSEDTFSQNITSEIDHSIHYLKKLKSNLRNG